MSYLSVIIFDIPAGVAGYAAVIHLLFGLSRRPHHWTHLDWTLPGRPLADLLVEMGRLCQPPYVIVLGNDEIDLCTVLDAGGDAFMEKGASTVELLATIHQMGSAREAV